MSARNIILTSYAEWTVLSALRVGSPIRSKKEIYSLLKEIDFSQLTDKVNGEILFSEFETWHKEVLVSITKNNKKLNNHFGWAAKIINIYLKTYCYLGGEGRVGIKKLLHPPIDSGVWKGVKKHCKGSPDIIKKTHIVNTISKIDTHEKYLTIISGFRDVSIELKCSLFEVEQLWEK